MANTVNYDFLNWNQMASINNEKIRADLWDLEFVRKPAAIPFPTDAYLRARMNMYDFQGNDDPLLIETIIRGFNIVQTAPPSSSGADLSIGFDDFSDQTITWCFNQWKSASGDYKTRMSYPKKAVTADIAIHITDVNKVKIRSLYLYDCVLVSCPFAEHGSGEGTDTLGTQMSVSIHCAYWERIYYNGALKK